MLEIRAYSIGELREVLGTKDKQGIDRKLSGYGIQFDSTGWGENRVYSIESIPEPFKMYAITKLGIPAQADFMKIRNLYYYFFCVDGFAEMPQLEMEAILEEDGYKMSYKVISKWLKYLEHLDYVSFSRSEFIYYAIRKENGVKVYQEISKELYLAGWHLYFDEKHTVGTEMAYFNMRVLVGGHPYKKPKVEQNVLQMAEIEELIDVINESFLNGY